MMAQGIELKKITEDEKRRRIVKNCDENIFVEAGAGAGKTSLIVNRIIEQLKSGMLPENIVVITFTNMAADELRSRIQEAVRKNELQNVSLSELNRMQISTIHSFCFKILKERVFDSGLPIDVNLLEEEDNTVVQEQMWKQWLDSLTASDWRLLNSTGLEHYKYISHINKVYKILCGLPEDTRVNYSNGGSSKKQLLADVKALLDDIKTDLLKYVGQYEGQIYTKLTDLLGNQKTPLSSLAFEFVGDMIDYEKLNTDEEKLFIRSSFMLEKVKGLDKKSKVFRANGSKDKKKETEEFDSKCRQTIGGRYAELLKQRKDYIYPLFIKYAERAYDFYKTNRPKNSLNNNQLIETARDLICNHEGAREHFQSRISCIYVDEFQDTDHIQEELIWALASEKDNREQLRTGALFLVGDPKQSIYRFRGAEPEIYLKVKEKMRKLGHNTFVYELSNNYRSNKKLIDWVNEAFADKTLVAGNPYIPMTAKNIAPAMAFNGEDKTVLLEGVYVYEKPCFWGEKNKLFAEEDGTAVAEMICQMVNSNFQITDKKIENGVEQYIQRPIQYDDFLILCANKDDMKSNLEIFEKYRIPVQFSGDSYIREEFLIDAYIRIYSCLASPADSRMWMSAIEAMCAARLIPFSYEKSEREQIARNQLKILRNAMKGMDAYGKAMYLAKQWHILLPKDVVIKDYQIKTIQTKLEQMIEYIFGHTCGNALELSDQFQKYKDKNIEKQLSLEVHPNSVRFMNLHKAKGLEGNIVIYMNRKESKGGRNDKYVDGFRLGKEFYPAFGYFLNVMWASYEGNQNVLDRINEEDEAESRRLEYVAATRAKQAFILMDSNNVGSLFNIMLTELYKSENQKPLPSIKSILDENPKIAVHEDHGKISKEISEAESETKNQSGDQDTVKNVDKPKSLEINKPKSLEINKQAVYGRQSPSQFEGPYRSIKPVLETENSEGQEIYNKRPKGNIFGTAMHRTLELVVQRYWYMSNKPFWNGKSEDLIKLISMSSISQAIAENKEFLQEEEIQQYRDFLEKVVHAFVKWMDVEHILSNVKEVYTELPFSYYEKQADTDPNVQEYKSLPIWMNGNADLVIAYKDGHVKLMDYKSDDDKYATEEQMESALRERYEGQLHVYQKAMKKVLNIEEKDFEMGIVSFSQKPKGGEQLSDEVRVRYTSLNNKS